LLGYLIDEVSYYRLDAATDICVVLQTGKDLKCSQAIDSETLLTDASCNAEVSFIECVKEMIFNIGAKEVFDCASETIVIGISIQNKCIVEVGRLSHSAEILSKDRFNLPRDSLQTIALENTICLC